ncbi:MAG: HAD family hydrolase [Spirochaetales bacterium]|nr:HAD family hydrolase [Spirochaetales bacterium]
MKYKCLILDHDDTSVRSTKEIHHPAHVETIKRMRPGTRAVDLDTWFLKNFNPGIMEFLTDELGFSEEEMKEEFAIWHEFNKASVPHFFDGIIELIKDFQGRGGIVAVVSHSEAGMIKQHYKVNGRSVMPDMIFGWDDDPSKRKPAIWPVEQIKSKYGFAPEDILMVDDLKPGLIMAKNASVPIAGAGWGHSIPEIESYMREHCDYYFSSVSELSALLKDY